MNINKAMNKCLMQLSLAQDKQTAVRLANSDIKVPLIERKLFGGTCVKFGSA